MSFYDPSYYRLDNCYGYGDVYGYGPGYGSIHDGFRSNYVPPPPITLSNLNGAVGTAAVDSAACGDRPCGSASGLGCQNTCSTSGNCCNPPLAPNGGCGPCGPPPGFTGYRPVNGRPYIYTRPDGSVFYGTYYPYGPWTNIPSAPIALPVGLPPCQPPC
jgi:hypothetical protein